MAVVVATVLVLSPAIARAAGIPDRAASTDGTWARIVPGYRLAFGHVAIDDPPRGRMIVFGVLGATYGDPEITWAWTRPDGWAPLETAGTPPPSQLQFGAAIRDPVRDRMIVFGGSAGYKDLRNQTWALDLSGTPTWSLLEPQGSPPTPRLGLSAVYDPIRDRMIVFGGSDGTRRNDVWALDLSVNPPAWTQLSPQGVPPDARYYHAAAYDSIGDRMIVVGGSTAGGAMNDVWALSLAGPETWTQLSPSGPLPPARYGASLVYDTAGERVVLFGGQTGSSYGAPFLNDTWALDLSGAPAWEDLAPTGTLPAVRSNHTAVYDAAHGDMAVFAGATPLDDPAGVRGDLWVLPLSGAPAWEEIMSDHHPPVQNSLDAALYYPARDLFFVGGSNSCATMSNQSSYEVLSLGDAIPSWTDFSVGPVDGGTIVYDQAREEVVSFGGWSCAFGGVYNSTYGKSLIGNPSWSLTDGALPPARYDHTAIAASQHDEMLIFGGDPGYGAPLFNDVWALSLASPRTWTQLFPTGTPPPPCTFATSIYDPPNDRMIVFSGRDSFGVWHNDVWALSLSTLTWTTLTPSGTPPHPGGAYYLAVYDGTRDRMLVAGSTLAGVQVWALSLDGAPAWAQLAPAGPVPVSSWGELVADYDPVHDRLLIQIDGDPYSYIPTETWALTFGGITAVPAQGEARAELAIAQQPNPGHALSVSFTLPDARPATIEAFDVSGRRVAEARFDGLEPGRHTVTLGAGARLAPGLYLIRLSHGGRSAVARAVVVN